MKPITMIEEALRYPNEWVAFSLDCQHVLGHGRTSEEASEMADDSGQKYFLYFIPEVIQETIVQ